MSPLDALGLRGLPDDLERIEDGLRAAVAHADPFLGEVAGHLVTAGGKRLRPALTIVAARAARGADAPTHDDVITGGCSVELVHLGSLYHDDVIDEAETRRGVESVNARWSNIVAILAGDFLLARASELGASLGADVAGLLAATIGELCRGQVLELQNLFNPDHARDAYLSAIAGKTASLFATSCRIGGMVSEVDADTLESLTAFGDHLGMCFQIVDDILDLTADTDTLGKPAGNDLMEGVYTLPVIAAVERSAEVRARLGGEIGPEEGGVDIARDVAIAEAEAANAVLRSAAGLDAGVTAGMTRLVDGLIDRTS
jgi:heptaprenyl diphosphate synthase